MKAASLLLAVSTLLVTAQAAAAAVRPDLTSRIGMRLGNRFVEWGGAINVTQADALARNDTQCTYQLQFEVGNEGPVAVKPGYGAALIVGGNTLGGDAGPALAPFQRKLVTTTVSLTAGTTVLQVVLDPANVVAEAQETNNVFSVTVHDAGFKGGGCADPVTPLSEKSVTPLPEIKVTPLEGKTPPLPRPELSGGAGIMIGNGRTNQKAPWEGKVTLTAKDVRSVVGGKCVFAFGYELANKGSVDTGRAVDVHIYADRDIVARQTVPALKAGQSRAMSTQLALPPETGRIAVLFDAGDLVMEEDESDNMREIMVDAAACNPKK